MAEWISYESADEPVCEVSIDVDLDDDSDFRKAHPIAIIVTARGFDADSDGQPSGTQTDGLYELEQAVEKALDENGGALACSATAGGSFTLYGYAASPSAEGAVRAAASSNAFRVDVASESDAGWKHYNGYILRGEELEEARDEDQIEQLLEVDEDATTLYEVAFSLEFDTYRDAAASVDGLAAAGYYVNAPFPDATDYDISAAVTMQLDAAAIKAARLELQAIIAQHSGHYAGWGAQEATESA